MSKNDELKIFISYSHKDKKYKERLVDYLKGIKLTRNIEIWHDGEINAGEDIDKNILNELSSSDIVLLLVSINFINSSYCIENELKKAIERMNKGECVIVPIMLSKCDIDPKLSWSNLKRVPEDSKAIKDFKKYDDGYNDVSISIKKLIDSMLDKNTKYYNENKEYSNENKDINESLYIKLLKNGEIFRYNIDEKTWQTIQTVKERIIEFNNQMNGLLIATIYDYKKDYSKHKKSLDLPDYRKSILKNFLMKTSTNIKKWILQEIAVRIHFRILKNNKYVGYTVVDGELNEKINCKWANKLRAMNKNSSMIYHSNRLNAPLIMSLNRGYHVNGNNDDIYIDYITSAFKFSKLIVTPIPLVSMGISVEKTSKDVYFPYFIALVFSRLDKIIENYIILLCEQLNSIDKGFDISNIINT